MGEKIITLWQHHTEFLLSLVICLLSSLYFYLKAKWDGEKTYNDLKKNYQESQKQIQILQKKLDSTTKHAVEHDNQTSILKRNVEIAIQSLYANNEQNADASDVLIRVNGMIEGGKTEEAQNYFEVKKTALKGTIHLHYIDALIKKHIGNYKEALDILRVITDAYDVDSFKEFHKMYELKGEILQVHFRNFKEAITEYKRALKFVHNDKYLLNIAFCFINDDQFEKAKESLNAVKDKKSINYKFALAIWFKFQNDFGKSLELLDEILAEDPRHILSLVQKSSFFFLEKDYTSSIDLCSMAIQCSVEKSEEHKQALGMLGHFYMYNGHYLMADNLLSRIIYLYPDDREFLSAYLLANLEMKKYEIVTAQAERKNLLAEFVVDTEILTASGLAFYYTNKPEIALEYFKKIITEHPFHEKTINNLCLTYLRLKEIDKADYFAKIGLKTYPESAMLINNQGVVYMYEGRIEEASEMFKKALIIDSQYDLAEKNLNLLAQIKRTNEADSTLTPQQIIGNELNIIFSSTVTMI